METFYEIRIHWIAACLNGVIWRFFYKAKRRVLRVINRWVNRLKHANERGLFIRPAINEREGLDFIYSDRVYQTDTEKRENKCVARRFFEVEFGWEVKL